MDGICRDIASDVEKKLKSHGEESHYGQKNIRQKQNKKYKKKQKQKQNKRTHRFHQSSGSKQWCCKAPLSFSPMQKFLWRTEPSNLFFEWESLLENAKIELAKERFCWQGEVLASAKKNKQNKNKNK